MARGSASGSVAQARQREWKRSYRREYSERATLRHEWPILRRDQMQRPIRLRRAQAGKHVEQTLFRPTRLRTGAEVNNFHLTTGPRSGHLNLARRFNAGRKALVSAFVGDG